MSPPPGSLHAFRHETFSSPEAVEILLFPRDPMLSTFVTGALILGAYCLIGLLMVIALFIQDDDHLTR